MLHSPPGYSYTTSCYTGRCIYAVIFTLLDIEKYSFSNYFPYFKMTDFNYLNFIIVP